MCINIGSRDKVHLKVGRPLINRGDLWVIEYGVHGNLFVLSHTSLPTIHVWIKTSLQLNWNELLANDMVKDAEKHTQSDTNNNSCDNPNQNGDSEDETEVVPVEIRPGHIRFEPLGKGLSLSYLGVVSILLLDKLFALKAVCWLHSWTLFNWMSDL